MTTASPLISSLSMTSLVALASLGVVAGVAVYVATRKQEDGGALSGIENAFNEGLSYMGGVLPEGFGFVKASNMAKVDRSLVNHPNVRAFFRVIRQGESSQDDSIAYRMIVGGQMFTSFADHPRISGKCWTVNGKRLCSSAAGAYQITKTTWDEVRQKMGLVDFSPASQDMAALGRISYRGALPAVLAGDLKTATAKLRDEWTSLPGAKENNAAAGGLDNSRKIFLSWGGQIAQAYA